MRITIPNCYFGKSLNQGPQKKLDYKVMGHRTPREDTNIFLMENRCIVTWLLFDLKKLFSKGRVQNKSGKFYFCVWTAPSTCNLNFEILFGSFCSVSLGIPSLRIFQNIILKLSYASYLLDIYFSNPAQGHCVNS